MPSDETKFLLRENQIPTAWFNVVPSMPTPPSPPLHPGTRQPIGPDDLAPLFPMALIGQEVTTQEWIDKLKSAELKAEAQFALLNGVAFAPKRARK